MKYRPQWIQRAVVESGGRDPLGLSRISDHLTQFLLPGIITTTSRARYYSFYAWAIGQARGGQAAKVSRSKFEAEFQRREAAFAIASRLRAEDGATSFGSDRVNGLVGTNKVNKKIAEAEEDGDIDTGFSVLDNPLGGLGNYYKGCLHRLGVITDGAEDGLPALSGLGSALADDFASATRGAPYVVEQFGLQRRVPMKVLRESSTAFSLDALRGPAAAAERERLTRMFFGFEDVLATLQGEERWHRQATLGQLLHVLNCYADANLPVARQDADRALVFWPHYFGSLLGAVSDERPYEPVFAAAHGYWRQFCCHHFFAFALEKFFAVVLDELEKSGPVTENELLEALVTAEFVDALGQAVGGDCSHPHRLLAELGVMAPPEASTRRTVRRTFGAAHRLNEWSIRFHETPLVAPMSVLALLYGKWRGEDEDPAFLEVQRTAQGHPWVGVIFPWLDRWLAERPDWRTAFAQLLGWLWQQHERTKSDRQRFDASWLSFDASDRRWNCDRPLDPPFRSSRHWNAVFILQDLALVDATPNEAPLRLTASGREVLARVCQAFP